MSEPRIEHPEVHGRSGFSVVWLIPILTLLIGGWLIFRTLADQGPVVTIEFRTAAGIEAGRTRVKYKSVDIGVVERVQFAEDFGNVMVRVRFDPGMDNLLRRNTRFWVVRPELSLRGASGLETLISGAYIQVDPGPGSPQRHFVGLEQQPLITADEPGRTITLVTERLGGIDAGSPIYYRGILAGEVLGRELASDRRSIYISAFVRDPFDQLVRGNSRFWNVSGMDVGFGAEGPEVRMESLQSLIFGGIAFETPAEAEQLTADAEDLLFTLHDSYRDIEERAYIRKLNYVLYFDGSVRGLAAGAPVEFRGIRIGSVSDVRLELDPETLDFNLPVRVEIEPERIMDVTRGPSPEAVLESLVKRGLRARLQTGSLLTGQLFVELDMYPDSELRLRKADGIGYPELPTVPGAMETITASIEKLVGQLDEIALDEIAANLLGTLEGTNALLNAPELERMLVEMEGSVRAFRGILEQVEASDMEATLVAARGVLGNLERTLAVAADALDPQAPMHYNLLRMFSELEETARAIRALVELLEREPQSVIFGRGADE
ncbi:MAG: MCE family protein [Gammaproteobacteria bacterium]|nr:MCE family protein [Gammaproteobacteria bacterium]